MDKEMHDILIEHMVLEKSLLKEGDSGTPNAYGRSLKSLCGFFDAYKKLYKKGGEVFTGQKTIDLALGLTSPSIYVRENIIDQYETTTELERVLYIRRIKLQDEHTLKLYSEIQIRFTEFGNAQMNQMFK